MTAGDVGPQSISLGSKDVPTATAPAIACTLGPESMGGRFDEWQTLLTHVVRRESIDGGVRAVFSPTTPWDELMRLTAAEQDCCQFFDFAITVDRRGIALEIRAPIDALSIVHALFGAAA